MTSAAPLPGEARMVEPDLYAGSGYPHETWTTLRREAPVRWVEREHDPFWALTRHADIVQVGRQPELFLNAPLLVIPEAARRDRDFEPPPTLIQMDPPEHGLQRRIIARRFKPGALRRMHADIERIAREIVESLLDEGEEGEVDFVEKVSAPLPIAVIAWLLGVPRSDWPLLFDWTNRIIGASDPEYQREGEAAGATASGAMMELFQYFTELVETRRRKPEDDLVTVFTQAEVDGRRLEPMEILSWCNIIVVAGNETTRNATSGGMLALIEHPDQLHKIQADPSLLRPGIEEILRWTSPIIHFARTASEDTELRGQKIRKGDRLALFYPSANRDEEVFDDPFRFDVTRHPNRHLAFGIGEHFCAGAHVARLELEMAYRYLLPRIEHIELAGDVQRLHSNLVGGIKHLPVRYRLKPVA